MAAVKGLHERAQYAADERIAQERETYQALEQQWRTELEEVRQRCLTLDGQCNELGKVKETPANRKPNPGRGPAKGAAADSLARY